MRRQGHGVAVLSGLGLLLPLVHCVPDLGLLSRHYQPSGTDAGDAAADGPHGVHDAGDASSASGSTSAAGAGGTPGGTGAGGAGGVSAGFDAGPPVYSEVPVDAGAELTGPASANSWQNVTESWGGIYPPNLANDGDPTTRWCAADGSAGQWWQVDLGASHTLTWISIMWEYPACAAGEPYLYTVSTSPDGATFDVAIDETQNVSTIQTQALAFPSGSSGRYVRITVTGLPPPQFGSATWASMYEVKVYGDGNGD